MHQYQPTIIETRSLLERLLIQIAFLRDELNQSWIEFKKNPVTFSKSVALRLVQRLRTLLSTPNVVPAMLAAVAVITCVLLIVVIFDKTASRSREVAATAQEDGPVMLDVSKPVDSTNKPSTGKDGPGRVGFQDKKGEGSGPQPKLAQGGGGGGNHIPIRHKPESCRRLHQFSLLYQPRLQLIRQHFQLPASISTLRCGKISRHPSTAIRDRSLKSNLKVRATGRESEQTVAQASGREMDQVSDRERRETWAAAPGSSVVVVRAVGLTAARGKRFRVRKSNSGLACYSNPNPRKFLYL